MEITNFNNNPLIEGCNYHLTWQSHPAMRFVLDKIDGKIAVLKTRKTKRTIKTHIKNLIFIQSGYNMKKANILLDTAYYRR